MITESPETELETLRREMELSSLGDKPHSISADKLRRLIELESQAGESPTNHDHESGEFDRQCLQCNPARLAEEELEARASTDHESRAESPTTLPACPFCPNGGKPWAWKSHDPKANNRIVWCIACESCACEGPEAATEAEAIAAWSRRTASVGADAAAKADTIASKIHDLIYAEPFDREAASNAIWELHEILRAEIVPTASPSDAAEIVAEMAQEAEIQVVAFKKEDEDANRGASILYVRYKGMADSLREAERRIRAAKDSS